MNRGIYRSVAIACYAVVGPPMLRAADITVSAAISTEGALTEAAAAFEKQTGNHVLFNFLASGPLVKQIEQGAPVDVFVSAASGQMDKLQKRGLIDPATRKNVAANELVVIVPSSSSVQSPLKLENLADAQFHRIAVGEPSSVPAGHYAAQTLDASHLSDSLKRKLQTGINVQQVLEYVERGEVDAGFVYRSDALEAGDKVRVVCVIPAALHELIEYPAAVLAQSKHREEATQFLQSLLSPAGKTTLLKHGFTEPSVTTQASR